MKIHKEGNTTIFITFLFVAVVLLTFNHIFGQQTWFHVGLYALGLWFFIMIVRFFRSPTRETNTGPDKILCPADGKIVVIEKTNDPEYFHEERLQVSIFMSARNVHVNWFPVTGFIDYYKYHPGKHMVAFNPKASLLNERATTRMPMTTADMPMIFRLGSMQKMLPLLHTCTMVHFPWS